MLCFSIRYTYKSMHDSMPRKRTHSQKTRRLLFEGNVAGICLFVLGILNYPLQSMRHDFTFYSPIVVITVNEYRNAPENVHWLPSLREPLPCQPLFTARTMICW